MSINKNMYSAVIFTDNTTDIQISIPLGAFKVASVLRKHNYPTLVVNHLSKFSLDEVKKVCDLSITLDTLIVGFSTTFFQRMEEHDGEVTFHNMGYETFFPQGKEFEDQVVSYIKTLNPNTKIVIGGTKAVPNTTNTNIDYAVVGYSETSMVNLLDHLAKGTTLNKSYVNIHGISIVDDRKAPLYDFVGDEMIWEKTDILNHKVLPIEIGRGCIFKCKFCSYPLNGKKKLDYIKECDIIYEELLSNYERFGITDYFIVDDTFNDHLLKLKELEKVVNKLPFNPKFWCYTRLDLLCSFEEMIHVMHNIGVRAMYFGIETLDLTTGKLIGKGYDRQKQIEMIRYIRETYPDMSMHGSFIAGLPGEPLDSIKLTHRQLVNGDIPLHSWMTKAFIIFNDESAAFNSELDVNYSKYGYTITGKQDNFLIWQTNETSLEEAHNLAIQTINESRTKPYFYVPGHDSFEMINFGYEFEQTSRTAFRDFKWNIVKNEAVNSFLVEYKNQLFNILNAQVVELVDTQR